MDAILNHFHDYPNRIYKTLWSASSYFLIGIAIGMIGPSLLDFQVSVGKSLAEVTYIGSSMSLGCALGSLISM